MAIEEQYDSQHFLVDSINILLETIGEEPISTLDDVDNVLEAQLAMKAIIEAKRNILSKGWDINTDSGYSFNPDNEGYINIPPHVLDLNVVGSNIIIRDWKLYDKDNKTRVFTEPVSCEVIWNLDFDTLTHPLRYYITIVAARRFQARLISDQSLYAFTKEDENDALISAKQSNGFTGEFNLLDSNYGTNNFNVLSRL